MPRCPVCNHDVHTPLVLNLEAWAHLHCANCQTRLEIKPPRYGFFAVVWTPLFVLAIHSRLFEAIAFAFMFAIVSLMVFESIHPKVRVRKKSPPKPEIRLDINASSN